MGMDARTPAGVRWPEGVAFARESIDSGAAKAKVERLAAITSAG